MAKVTLAAGAEVDILSGAEFGRAFDDLAHFLGSQSDLRRQGTLKTYPGSTATVGAGGLTAVDCGSPPVGYTWDVVSVLFIGDEAQGPIANALAALYVGPWLGSTQTPGIAFMVLHPQGIPTTTTFGKDTFPVQGGEHVVAVFTGAGLAIGQHCNAIIRVYERPDEIPPTGRYRPLATTQVTPWRSGAPGRRPPAPESSGASSAENALEHFTQTQPTEPPSAVPQGDGGAARTGSR